MWVDQGRRGPGRGSTGTAPRRPSAPAPGTDTGQGRCGRVGAAARPGGAGSPRPAPAVPLPAEESAQGVSFGRNGETSERNSAGRCPANARATAATTASRCCASARSRSARTAASIRCSCSSRRSSSHASRRHFGEQYFAGRPVAASRNSLRHARRAHSRIRWFMGRDATDAGRGRGDPCGKGPAPGRAPRAGVPFRPGRTRPTTAEGPELEPRTLRTPAVPAGFGPGTPHDAYGLG